MLSLERIYSIIEQTWGRTDIAPLKAAAFARAIEREATAEAVQLMREWTEATRAREHAIELGFRTFAYYCSPERVIAAEQAIRDFVDRMK